ncbi:MAG: hypothetical protein WBC76_10945 [Actinomycetes bacterium]|jgi:hypothetical protein
MNAEEEPVFTVLDAPARGLQQARPRMRNVGLVHVVSALVLGLSLVLGTMQACTGENVRVMSSALLMAALIGVAGAAMTVRVPRATAVAPALAAGSALTLLGSSAAGWLWVRSQPCVGNMLDREVVTLLLVTASAAAVLATSLWLLVSRDEIEPWHAARGVLVSTVAAVTALVLGVGFAVLMRGATEMPASAMAVVALTWAVAVAATGWLRPSPAIAAVTPAILQALWLLVA